jgi:hypothetical protein
MKPIRNLTPFQMEFILQNNGMKDKTLASLLGCKVSSVSHFRRVNGLRRWEKMSKDTIEYIKANSNKKLTELAIETGYTIGAISRILRKSGIKKYQTRRDKAKRVSHREFEILKMGVDPSRLKEYNRRIIKGHRYHRWTSNDIDLIRKMLKSDCSIEIISLKLDRTVASVNAILYRIRHNLI